MKIARCRGRSCRVEGGNEVRIVRVSRVGDAVEIARAAGVVVLDERVGDDGGGTIIYQVRICRTGHAVEPIVPNQAIGQAGATAH